MHAPDRLLLADIQSQADRRNVGIDAVGIKGVRYSVTVRSGSRLMPTIATLAMMVALPPTVEAENFESIHNHSAFARDVQPPRFAR